MNKEVLHFTSGFEIKEAKGSDTITINGFANTTAEDRQGDIIKEEAWNKGGLKNYLKNPIVLAFHDHTQPIGAVIEHSISEKGLHIVAEIPKAAGRVYDLVKSKILKSFSIGFMVKDAHYDKVTELFVIDDLELLEISVVSVPANADSVFSIKKCLETEEAYNDFKKEYIQMPKEIEKSTEKEVKTPDSEDIKKDLETAIDSKLESGLETLGIKLTDNITAALELALEENNKMPENKNVEVKDSGVEKLLADLTKRMEDKENADKDVLDGLRTEIQEKADEIKALQTSRMSFQNRNTDAVEISAKEIDDAVFVSKLLDRPISETVIGKALIEKSNSEHIPGLAADTKWEEQFSTSIFNDVRNELIIEPLFRTISMTTPTLHIPINPEAEEATWITPDKFRIDGSTGVAQDHKLTDTLLQVHKLAAKEYIGYEELEDTILPILPIIREAVVRRMANTSDKSLLIGVDGGDAANGAKYPFDGLAARVDANSTAVPLSITAEEKVTAAKLQEPRRLLGTYGLNPGNIKYLVSMDAYYDLLEDPEFRRADYVGLDRATLITGQVGSIAGSPVIVSHSFAPKAATEPCVVVVYTPNFVVGNLRGMMVERDRNIEQQKNIIVATRRLGFLGMIVNKGVASISWAA